MKVETKNLSGMSAARRILHRLTKSTSQISPSHVCNEEEKIKTKKILCFSPEVRVYSIISRHDISVAEREAAWFNQKEYRIIQTSCFKQVRMMEKNERLRGRKYCARGLEGYTKFGLLQKNQSRILSIRAVLDEQNRHDLQDIEYQESISTRC